MILKSKSPLHLTCDPAEQAACVAAARLRRTNLNGSLVSSFNLLPAPDEREVAKVEGWILGVP